MQHDRLDWHFFVFGMLFGTVHRLPSSPAVMSACSHAGMAAVPLIAASKGRHAQPG